MKKGQFSPTRRIPCLEALEDRTLLSGNVLAALGPTPANPTAQPGDLNIVGDIGNNAIHIFEYNSFGVNELRVAGDVSFVPFPSVTSVNGVGFTDFALSSVSRINITMLNGNDSVIIGENGTPPAPIPVGGNPGFIPGLIIPGNITINAGSGVDTFRITGTNTPLVPAGGTISTANIITITATGPGADNVKLTTVHAGQASIVLGTGNDTVDVGASTLGSLGITTQTGGNETITVHDSPGVFPVRPSIGLLNISAVTTGNDTITVNNDSIGRASITAGTGKNTITVTNSEFTTTAGPVPALNIIDDVGGSALQTVTLSNDSFVDIAHPTLTGGNVSITVGNGPQYWDKTHLLPGSTFTMNKVTGMGTATINLGNFFENVTLGDNTADSIGAKNLNLTVGDNANNVLLNQVVTGADNITVGSYAVAPGSPLPPPPAVPPSAVSLNGSAGSLSLTVGSNYATITQAKLVAGAETIKVGDNAGNVTITRPSAGPSMITVGNNAGNVTVNGTDTGKNNETIVVGTGAGSVNVHGAVGQDESITVGDNFGSITVDVTVGRNETVTAGNGNGSVNVTSAVGGTQTVSVGNGTGAVNVFGGTTDEVYTFGDGHTIGLGGNASSLTINLGNNDTLTVGTTVTGAVLITPINTATATGGNNDTINVASPSVGSLTIQGNTNAANPPVTTGFQNVTINVTGVVANTGGVTGPGNDITIMVGDNAVSISVTNSISNNLTVSSGNGITANNGSSFIFLSGDMIENDLNVNTAGGNNTVALESLTALDALFSSLGTGINTVFAMGVTSLFGNIDGGSGGSSVYYDLGGNSGFTTTGFAGYYVL